MKKLIVSAGILFLLISNRALAMDCACASEIEFFTEAYVPSIKYNYNRHEDPLYLEMIKLINSARVEQDLIEETAKTEQELLRFIPLFLDTNNDKIVEYMHTIINKIKQPERLKIIYTRVCKKLKNTIDTNSELRIVLENIFSDIISNA